MSKKSTEITIQTNYNSIDLFKLIMAYAVIAIHTQPLMHCSDERILNLYGLLVTMAVPFFFITSGYLLASKLTYPYQTNNDLLKIKKYLFRIIYMYLFWTFIYCPLAIYHFVSSETPLLKSLLLYIRGFFLVGEQYNSWHLWYLLSTIYALFVVIFLLKIKMTLRGIIFVSFIVSMISIGIDGLIDFEGNLPFILNFLKNIGIKTIINGRILRGIIYIPIGMCLAYKKIPQIINWILMLGGFACNWFIDNTIVSEYMLIITAIGLFGIIEKINLKDRPIYVILRDMSTIIYLIHMYIWSFYYKLMYGEKTYGLDCYIITSVVASLMAIGFILYKKTNQCKVVNNKHKIM